MKTLAARMTDVAGLPEALREFYTKGDDGKYTLNVESAEGFSLENVQGLKTALSTEKGGRKTAEDALKAMKDQVGDLDLVKAREAITENEALKSANSSDKIKLQIESAVRTATTKLAEENAAFKIKVEKADKLVDHALRRSAHTAAIVKAKGVPELLLPHLENATKLKFDDKGNHSIEVVDAQGTMRYSMKSGSGTTPMGLDELVEEMKVSPIFSRAFEGTQASGGGAPPDRKNGQTGKFTISKTDAQDAQKYRAVREEAAKAGQVVQVLDE